MARVNYRYHYARSGFIGDDERWPETHSLNEDAALNLLLRILKHDQIYAKRISLDCVTFDAEEKTVTYFQFALRENHTTKCGGDPATAPVIDRYRVYRASRKIEWLNPVEDSWQRYDPTRIADQSAAARWTIDAR